MKRALSKNEFESERASQSDENSRATFGPQPQQRKQRRGLELKVFYEAWF